MGTWFYDRFGYATILLLNTGARFVDRYGRNLGYIHENKIYNYNGRHCGWIEGGVIRDLSGQTVSFCLGAQDFPMPLLPIPQIPPIPSIPQIPPIPAIREIPRIKPIKTFGWSSISPLELF